MTTGNGTNREPDEGRRWPARFTRSLAVGFLVAGVIGIVTGVFAWRQVESERRIDMEDVERRATALAQQYSLDAERALSMPDDEARRSLWSRLYSYRRLRGQAVFRRDGSLLAANPEVAEMAGELDTLVRHSMSSHETVSDTMRIEGVPLHTLAMPIASGGAIVVVHDVSYIDGRANGRLLRFGLWILLVSLLVLMLVVGFTWFAFERPMRLLEVWMRRLRTESLADAPPDAIPYPGLRSETSRLAASYLAAKSAGQLLSQATVQADHVWTQERLRAHATASIGIDRQLIVVSNREPYMHREQDGVAEVIVPAGGLVTALDPVLQSCGGTWIAHGSGDADRQYADATGRLVVPPDEPRYTLKRVWLSREEENGYYYGFANEGLWPLCHLAHERPVFRATDWDRYRSANERFAAAVLDEIGDGQAIVLVQDYHLALVPGLLKAARPEQRVGIFWHIPWPGPDTFRVCPWAAEIVAGMLGADLIGFHLRQYCNNFLETVDRLVESRLDRDRSAIEFKGQTALVRPFPISVQAWSERGVPTGDALELQLSALRHKHHLEGQYVAVGVDRIDYTKGLLERLRAIDRFLEKYPEYCGRFTFVELGAPSRTHLRRYRELLTSLEALADEINWKHQTDGWKPIHLLVSHHDSRAVYAFMRIASMCIVSSLHDGMNLVAKEFVAASSDGVLVLSEFAGAAHDLPEALIVNPYDTEGFAETIRAGIEMDPVEREMRLTAMRNAVEERNVYRWASELITTLGGSAGSRPAEASKAPATELAVES